MYTHTLSFTTEEFYLATDVQVLKRLLDSYRTMSVHYCLHWQELTKYFITKNFLYVYNMTASAKKVVEPI